jgi:hypothetical protein
MKTIKQIIPALFLLLHTACNETDFLVEKPLSFYSPENSYMTKADFQAAVNNLYVTLRLPYYDMGDDQIALYYGNDFAYNATAFLPGQLDKLNDYNNVMIPTYSPVLYYWVNYYSLIRDANTVISRLDAPESLVGEADKEVFKAEALFFRAYAYRSLAHLFGGVPILKEEVTGAKRDYVRATREDTYRQSISDLKDAIVHLPAIEAARPGQASKQAAQHLLSEVYLSLRDWDNAIQAASALISYQGVGIMTERFGSAATEEGDPYRDLFMPNNQNRTSGNREALFVVQYDMLPSGTHHPGSSTGFNWPRMILPMSFNLTAKDDGGATLFLTFSDKKGGRGIGWARPTSHFLYDIWTDGAKDCRNSPYTIVRDFRVDNPASKHFGKWIVADSVYLEFANNPTDSVRNWYPFLMKTAITKNFPPDLYKSKDPSDTTAFGERLLQGMPNYSYMDHYLFRLAETYLIRAEAYLGKNDKNAAAADINVIRNRANATPATPAEITIDYILDERLRELYTEEQRMMTLCRLSLHYDRTKRYNPYAGVSIQPHHNLWPIPYSEIERNSLAPLEQNAGYSN